MASTDNILLTKPSNIVYYGTCSTSGSVRAKIVTLDNGDNFTLEPGTRISVTFQYSINCSSMTLNVNNTGAINATYGDSTTLPSPKLCENYAVLEFIYERGAWCMTANKGTTNCPGYVQLANYANSSDHSLDLAMTQNWGYFLEMKVDEIYPYKPLILYQGSNGIGTYINSSIRLEVANPNGYPYGWDIFKISVHLYGTDYRNRATVDFFLTDYMNGYENGAYTSMVWARYNIGNGDALMTVVIDPTKLIIDSNQAANIYAVVAEKIA